ncbi:MAG: FlgD immunoglobulin-like domain containing protein [Elusimicrobiales bacterium]
MRANKYILLLAFIPALSAPAFAVLPTPGQREDSRRFRQLSAAAQSRPKKEISAAARKAFSDFRKRTSQNWRVRYNSRTGAPASLTGGTNLRYTGAPESAAQKFFAENSALLNIDPAQLSLAVTKTALGITHLVYQQSVDGLPVEKAKIKLHIDGDGNIVSAQSSFAPDARDAARTPVLSAAAASAAAMSDCGGFTDGLPSLSLLPYDTDGTIHLAWKVPVSARGPLSGKWHYFIDARTGAVLSRESRLEMDAYLSSGTVQGHIYRIHPDTSPADLYWGNVSTVPITHQYVWLQSCANRSDIPTDSTGWYYFYSKSGKVLATLSGPYFTVTSNRGKPMIYANGSGSWSEIATSASSPDPYPADSVSEATVTVSGIPYIGMMMPVIDKIDIGDMDSSGNIYANDMLHVMNPADGTKQSGYIGLRGSWIVGGEPFEAGPVMNTSYVLRVEPHYSGGAIARRGYTVSKTRYFRFADPTTPGPSGTTQDFTWTWSNSQYPQSVEEVNVFYHLNAMRDYFANSVDTVTANGRLVNLDTHLPAVVHAYNGPPPNTGDGMMNAFYDDEQKIFMFGDGRFGWQLNPQRWYSFAMDATIIRHEYVHFVTDSIYKRAYSGEGGALSEALSDYFALSSLNGGTPGFAPLTNKVAEFVTTSSDEGKARDLAYDCSASSDGHCAYPADLDGEVHDDSLMLSRSMWRLRSAGYPQYMGTQAYPWLGINSAVPRADVYLFNALFFYPDTFIEFYEDLQTLADRFHALGYDFFNYQSQIQAAFAAHGISGQKPSGGDIYEYNDGPETATDISKLSQTAATVYPAYDEDFYTFPCPAGTAQVRATLPRARTVADMRHVLELDIFSANMTQLAAAHPVIANPQSGDFCPEPNPDGSGECVSYDDSVTTTASVPQSGYCYARVRGGPTANGGPCADVSTNTYTVSVLSQTSGGAQASIVTASFDNDLISFTVPCNRGGYNYSPVWLSTMTAQVEQVNYLQLRDTNMNPMPDSTTRAGGYLQLVSVSNSADMTSISGQARLLPGFDARHPSVGAVYLEVFGEVRYRNIMTGVSVDTETVSLGISGPINLTAYAGSVIVWNNIFNNSAGGKATVRYDAFVPGTLTLRIYSPDGTLVRSLFSGWINMGKGSVDWDGANDNGSKVAAGMYILSAKGPAIDTLRKIIVVK